MCLSTVYQEVKGERSKLCEYVSNVTSSEGSIVMTDIMGREISVRGTLKSMDLIKNEIIIAGD
ncbi:MAG: CooT family nickel-binding protein [Oscillospiraceae bacterium]|nr:CooT family nickel-binding protein [Oscillospiraceae bacterium]